MFAEDDAIRPKPSAVTLGEPLDRLSEAELDERIAALEAEIERCAAARDAKKQGRLAADSVFKR